ncbi:MAG: 3-phosphoserine/phosphohydroxythreonine transaminase [Gammaproteobacteria bacterium]|nr:3-phosphoserine/phosphohydroxythreonine transaminase [Gammaproteobacteria bacterium]
MKRAYNFSAGPAMLPGPVIERLQDEIGNWQDTGMGAMEMSHRGAEFTSIAEKAETDLRDLLSIPESYRVLFMQGGATAQFAAVPMNLCAPGDTADYLVSGYWSRKALKEGARFCQAHIVFDTADNNDTSIPEADQWRQSGTAAFTHYVDNETIGGLRLPGVPEVDSTLVVDMSSSILSAPLKVEDYGLIYAGAQKNMGPAGLTIVIIREDLLNYQHGTIPAVLDYRKMADSGSMLNTPPTFAWYTAGLVFEWALAQGGVEKLAARSQANADRIYQAIDDSAFYSNPVAKKYRSLMNIPFMLADDSLDGLFLEQAAKHGLMSLKGHRSVGGMRASIYNAMPDEGIDALVEFMGEFERANG